MCKECELLDAKRLTANMNKTRLENQLLISSYSSCGVPNTSLEDEYIHAVTECDLLFSAYRAHQQIRHGVTVRYVGRLSGGEE
jgi:hypothetical protein